MSICSHTLIYYSIDKLILSMLFLFIYYYNKAFSILYIHILSSCPFDGKATKN
nr:MAG TPA: hypothetical protein [Caudoviricetes sp.]